MHQAPDQIKTQEDYDYCVATETEIFVFDVHDLNGDPVANGYLTGISGDVLYVNNTPFSGSRYVFLTSNV
jgi:hypothetical protein